MGDFTVPRPPLPDPQFDRRDDVDEAVRRLVQIWNSPGGAWPNYHSALRRSVSLAWPELSDALERLARTT